MHPRLALHASLYKGPYPKHPSSCLSSNQHFGALLDVPLVSGREQSTRRRARQGPGAVHGAVPVPDCSVHSPGQWHSGSAFGDGEFFHVKTLLLLILELAQSRSSAGTPREGVSVLLIAPAFTYYCHLGRDSWAKLPLVHKGCRFPRSSMAEPSVLQHTSLLPSILQQM